MGAILALFIFSGTVSAKGGFNENGYNYQARIFNGTGHQWCMAKSLGENCLGDYSNDKIVMKWNAEWDRGNDENWLNPPYAAWTDNEWNGKTEGGSEAVWHYKIVWIGGDCGSDGTLLPDGGECFWGQFEAIQDHGVDPALGDGHLWYAHVTPNGYGAY